MDGFTAMKSSRILLNSSKSNELAGKFLFFKVCFVNVCDDSLIRICKCLSFRIRFRFYPSSISYMGSFSFQNMLGDF